MELRVKKCVELGVSSKNLKLLVNSKATKKGIQGGIKSASKKVLPGQTFLFYFSGLGWTGPDVDPVDEGDGLDEYIAPYDSSSASFTCDIRDDELEAWLTPITQKGARVLVILDSSCSEGMVQGLTNLNGQDRKIPVKTMPGRSSEAKSVMGGFAKNLNKAGFTVMTAASLNGKAYEWRCFQNSVFTHLLVSALDGCADDSFLNGPSISNDDHYITDAELFYGALDLNTVYFNVLDRLGQSPQVYGAGGHVLFYLP
jgi:uncharacterized caspase-like protein